MCEPHRPSIDATGGYQAQTDPASINEELGERGGELNGDNIAGGVFEEWRTFDKPEEKVGWK